MNPDAGDRPDERLDAASLFDLTGRVALVTGGGSGLGRAIAEVLAVNGARVVIAGKDAGRLGDAVQSLSRHGPVAAEPADVTKDDDVRRMFDAAEAAFGTVDLLVNGAGIGHRGGALDISRETWRAVGAVNAEAAFVVAQEGAGRMIAAGRGGAIVNIASFLHDKPMRGVAAYAASKAAMHQMTRSLAFEWARHGIRVNEIVPGWFPTDMTEPFLGGRAGEVVAQTNPMRRLGRPGDLAGAVLLLTSEAGAYMTGASIVVDGGQMLA